MTRSTRTSAYVAAMLLCLGHLSHSRAQPPERPKRPESGRAAVPHGAKRIADLVYAKVGDRKLLLDLYLPEKADGPLPVIVGIHGGGWAAGRKEEAQGIRQVGRGYAVAAVGYRLSGEAAFPAQIQDCKAAVRWLRANAKKYNLDPDRIGAVGHSAGGHLASLLGVSAGVEEFETGGHPEHGSNVIAVCAMSGPTDFLQMDAHATKDARLKHDFAASPESRLIGGPIQQNKEKVAKANPISYVGKTSPPFLLIHGDRDPVVPYHQTELLHDALAKAGADVRLHRVRGGGHGVGGTEVDELVDEFFDEHLKGVKRRRSDTPENASDEPAAKLKREVLPPVGLFVCRGPSPTPEKEVNFDFVGGWLVRPGWDRVEPREGEFDWTYIDSEIALARKLNKKVALCVLGGPQTPDWVFKAGAKEFAYTLPIGRRGDARIPLLWDETYQKRWAALVRALGRRYAEEEALVLVHITGATGNGLEMQLPFAPSERARWEKAGYSNEKAIAGWRRIVDVFAEAFPNKPLDIDIHPVLGSNQVAEAVVAYGSEKLGGRFGVFGGWLSGKEAEDDRHHAGMHALAAKYGKAGFSAWQMIASAGRSPGRFSDRGLTAAVEQGMKWNARYFEVWETDAMNPKLQDELRSLASRLAR